LNKCFFMDSIHAAYDASYPRRKEFWAMQLQRHQTHKCSFNFWIWLSEGTARCV
jgi:hypothetical protein